MSNSVEHNLRQAASDLLGVKAGLIAKGVEVPANTPTSEYEEKIKSIASGVELYADYEMQNGVLIFATAELSDYLTVTIPDNVTKISPDVLNNNFTITRVIISETVTEIQDGSADSVGQVTGAFSNCINLKTIIIRSGITTIGKYAFYGLYPNKSQNIVIPKTVTNIGDYAFFKYGASLNVYYEGTEEEWRNITFGSNTDSIRTAPIYYNYTGDGSEL